MAKRKQSRAGAGKAPKVGATKVKSAEGKARDKPPPRGQVPVPADSLLARTGRRIKDIGKRALAKLRGKGTGKATLK
jgi:hypothetical protein